MRTLNVIIKGFGLLSFGMGMAIMTKYYNFANWIDKRPYIALPMIVVGAVCIIGLWEIED